MVGTTRARPGTLLLICSCPMAQHRPPPQLPERHQRETENRRRRPAPKCATTAPRPGVRCCVAAQRDRPGGRQDWYACLICPGEVTFPSLRRISTAKRHDVGRRIVEMVGETRRRHGSDILCASVVLLASCLILCAALACSKTVPGEADVGTPSGDSTAAQASGSAAPAVAWIDSNALPLK
jgi:hypothetical protein